MTEVLKNIEFVLPDWIVTAMAYGDDSALNDDEILAVSDLVKRAGVLCEAHEGSHYHWSFSDQESEFSHTNDVDNMAGNVVNVVLVIMRRV